MIQFILGAIGAVIVSEITKKPKMARGGILPIELDSNSEIYIKDYYGIDIFAKGGEIKAKSIIIDKIGLNEANANYIIEKSPKFAIWLSDSIVKDVIKKIDSERKADEITGKPFKKATKNDAVEEINGTFNFIDRNYRTQIRLILDWLQHPLTPSQNLRELSLDEAFEKAQIFHEELKVLGGDVDFKEPDTNIILKRYPKLSDGTEYYWVLIPKNFCELESSRMGHCGRTGYGNVLISLRSVKPYGQGHTISDSHVTIAYGDNDGYFYQTKGKKNQKPSEKYYEYIYDLIVSMLKGEITFEEDNLLQMIKFNGFASEYDSTQDYGFDDMSKEQILNLYEIKPSIFDNFEGKFMLYELGITNEQPNTKITFEWDVEYVPNLLSHDTNITSDFIESVLKGDMQYYSGNSYSYYYDYAEDYVDDLNKDNYESVIDKIVEITGLEKSIVKENGAKHYLAGDDDDFPSDDFDDIKRSIASALTNAEEDSYTKYYYDEIKSALDELGNVKKLNDEGIVIEIDLSDWITLKEISSYMKEIESDDLTDVYSEAKERGDIELPNVSIDDRYQPYPDNINDYFDIDYYRKGGNIK